MVTLWVCASRWTEVWGFIGSWRKKQTKMAGVLKIIIIFVIFSLSVECRKDKVFCAICGKGLTASKSQRRAQFRAVSGNICDIVSCFGLPTDTSRIDGVLCNSCRTALLKYRKTGKKSLHVSSDRVQTCNFCAWKLNKTLWDSSKCLSVYMVIITALAPPPPNPQCPDQLHYPGLSSVNVSELPHPNP